MLPLAFVAPTVLVEPDSAAALELLQAQSPEEVAIAHEPPDEIPPTGGAYRVGQVARRTPNLVEVEAKGPGWLVLGEVWAPGWQADVDGAPAKLFRTNVAFSGLALPAGSHKVTLRYAPTGWVWGRWISLGTLIGMLIVTVVVLRRKNS